MKTQRPDTANPSGSEAASGATANTVSATGRPRVGPIPWLTAELRGSWLETRTTKTLLFSVPDWNGHDAGQHVDVKLTAEDGFSAQRSYSVASTSAPGWLQLTVQTVIDGEVSPYLVEVMAPGDKLELRGPIGGWFRWTEQFAEPVLLVGGGSGVVPLMAMLRQRIESGATTPFHLTYVARTPDHVFYANELHEIEHSRDNVTIDRLYTRSGLPDDTRTPGRLTLDDLPGPTPANAAASSSTYGYSNSTLDSPRSSRDEAAEAHTPTTAHAGTFTRVYVCGPTGFVEHATQLLVARGHPADAIRTERFGPSG